MEPCSRVIVYWEKEALVLGFVYSTFMLIPKHLRELGGRDKDLAVCDKLLISPTKRSHSDHTVKVRLSEIWI